MFSQHTCSFFLCISILLFPAFSSDLFFLQVSSGKIKGKIYIYVYFCPLKIKWKSSWTSLTYIGENFYFVSIRMNFGPLIHNIYCVINLFYLVCHQPSSSWWLWIISSDIDAILNNLIFILTGDSGEVTMSHGYKIQFFFYPKGKAFGEWSPQLKTGETW